MRFPALLAVACASVALSAAPARAASPAADLAAFTLRSELPPATGHSFAVDAAILDTDALRQALAADELIAGHFPTHQFDWVYLGWTGRDATGAEHEVEIGVAPDYLAVGTDQDFLYAPLGLPQALRVARALDFCLPTPHVVDMIYEAADHQFTPSPLPPTSEMRTPRYWLNAQRRISGLMEQPRTALLAGHKKDVVLTPRLRYAPSQLAIYGWHKAVGEPIQPVSLVHGKHYFDYSHGIRAVAPVVRIDGVEHRYFDVLEDPILAGLLSDEGPLDVDRLTANAFRGTALGGS